MLPGRCCAATPDHWANLQWTVRTVSSAMTGSVGAGIEVKTHAAADAPCGQVAVIEGHPSGGLIYPQVSTHGVLAAEALLLCRFGLLATPRSQNVAAPDPFEHGGGKRTICSTSGGELVKV